MHETLHESVKGHIDSKVTLDGNTSVVGWCFHNDKGVCSLRVNIDGSILPVITKSRPDVQTFYKRSNINMCGWEFTYSEKSNTVIEMNIDDKWYSIFSFSPNKLEVTFNKKIPSYIVVDNFYKDPDGVREFALKQTFNYHKDYHKGKRTEMPFRFDGIKERFEEILGKKITNWEAYGTNGVFQICVGGDQLVYHVDSQQYAGVLFLTPNAPPQTGTTLYRSKHTYKMKVDSDKEHCIVFKNGYLDPTEFDVIDVVGNVYNRIVLFDSKHIHSATNYFGNTLENGRLFQIFFFDIVN